MKLIAIITDIGGPVALHNILSELPQEFGTPIVVMQSRSEMLIESGLAALRHTTRLKIGQLRHGVHLHAGTVYFVKSGTSYQPSPNHDGLVLEVMKGEGHSASFGSSLVEMARSLNSELTVLFLSGRGDAAEITRVCSVLEQCGCSVLVLNRSESVVDELGLCALRATPSACELSTGRILELLLLESTKALPLRKTPQSASRQ